MEIITSDFVKNSYEDVIRKIKVQASIGEAFTFCKDKLQYYACCGIFKIFDNEMFLWMIVDKIMMDSKKNKNEFLSLCTGLKNYIKAKYHGNKVRCFVTEKEERYHNFVRHFGLSQCGEFYKGII